MRPYEALRAAIVKNKLGIDITKEPEQPHGAIRHSVTRGTIAQQQPTQPAGIKNLPEGAELIQYTQTAEAHIAIVTATLPDPLPRFAVWTYQKQTGGLLHGEYCRDRAEADAAHAEKVTLYAI